MKAHLHSVIIIVKDLTASIKFYRLLGLTIPDGLENESHVDCMTDDHHVYVCLVPEATVTLHRKGWTPQTGNTITLQFACENQNAVDVLYTMFINEEYQSSMPPYDTPWGERYAQVLDPDGNTIALFAGLGT